MAITKKWKHFGSRKLNLIDIITQTKLFQCMVIFTYLPIRKWKHDVMPTNALFVHTVKFGFGSISWSGLQPWLVLQAPLYSVCNKHFPKCILKFALPIKFCFCSSIKMVFGQVTTNSTIYNLFQFSYKTRFYGWTTRWASYVTFCHTMWPIPTQPCAVVSIFKSYIRVIGMG